ncbi:MAG: aminodeoxychorismate synthase component I [Planctomycetia bacterium]|nr:aminodeoxychorismate synthase component I [Planctomycetia bacterium]
MQPESPPTIGRNLRAACHQLTELDLAAPFWQYYRLYDFEPYSFLLDSAKDPEKLGRYSFLGADPFLVYKAKRKPRPGLPATARIEVTRRHDAEGRPLSKPIVEVREGDPFEDLRRVLDDVRVDYDLYGDHPVPLLAGAVGYFGYEAGYFIEDMPDLGADDLGMPDIYFMFHDVLLGHCHQSGRSFLSVVGRGENDDAARAQAVRLRDNMLRRIEVFDADPPNLEWNGPDPKRAAATTIDVHSHSDLAGYCGLVEQCKEHIFAGDIFEVCLTHRLDAPLEGEPWDLYQELRRINPAPFASYLNFPEGRVISSSPERYVSLGPDRMAESRPIKGTRRRGGSPEEDEQIHHELFSSTKDRAENVMIVDLVRNDFGRVCKFGTVHVPELMIVEPYATVFQMVSTIRGELEEGRDAIDLVQASFPGGSMTGAPKIEAMKIIDRLEPVKRGIYSGSIGYLDFAGTMDLSIVIRTFVERNGRCYFNVGGAIVADSIPQAEYYETLDKARALVTALANLKACQ